MLTNPASIAQQVEDQSLLEAFETCSGGLILRLQTETSTKNASTLTTHGAKTLQQEEDEVQAQERSMIMLAV